jgi:hypothetical protein
MGTPKSTLLPFQLTKANTGSWITSENVIVADPPELKPMMSEAGGALSTTELM